MKTKEFKDIIAKEFVIFKAGTWNGETFTTEDLDNMVKSYNSEDPIHIIAGHSSDYKGKTLIPSFGRVLGGLKRVGNELIAYGAEFSETMANWIKDGFYNQRSVEMTKDNKRILAIGMLGATPPAVKGMDLMQNALKETAMQFSEFGDTKAVEFAEDSTIEMTTLDEAEKLAIKDTVENVTQSVATFLKDIEQYLNDEADKDKLFSCVWNLQNDLIGELQLHADFITKVEQIEEGQENYSDKNGFKEFVEKIKTLFNKGKEKDEMDAKEKKEYQDKIDALELKVKEFADKEFALAEEKRIADEEKAKADALAKDEQLKEEIKTFCDNAIKENKMTPAIREKDEPIMFNLGKTSPEALKSFQEKYVAGLVPLGEVLPNKNKANDQSHQVIKLARQYVKENPKEFSGMSKDEAVSRAMFLHATSKIKFEGE